MGKINYSDKEIKTCEICGEIVEKSIYALRNICSEKCAEIDFWREYERFKSKGDINNEGLKLVRINGCQYTIGKEEYDDYSTTNSKLGRGSAGALFKIKFIEGNLAGETVLTTNLWWQGKIPENFCENLNDNAIFLDVTSEDRIKVRDAEEKARKAAECVLKPVPNSNFKLKLFSVA